MVGILDIGGGLKGVYSAGLYDAFLDLGVSFDYYLGVSAGSANLASFVAGQRGRNARFYLDFTFRPEYMGFRNWMKHGNFFNLDYVYGTLTNSDGEAPLDGQKILDLAQPFRLTTTDAATGETVILEKQDIILDDYWVFKASCAIPFLCQPVHGKGRFLGMAFYDGGVSDPIPYQKAFDDGVDRLVVVLNRPKDSRKDREKNLELIQHGIGSQFPHVVEKLAQRHEVFNREIEELLLLEQEGKVLLLGPDQLYGVSTTKKDHEAFQKLYDRGYEDGEKILAFL